MSPTAFTPSIYSLPSLPLPSNGVPTDTLTEQSETESLISSLFALLDPPTTPSASVSESGAGAQTQTQTHTQTQTPGAATGLRKSEHTQFLASTFFKLPGKFVSLDASRPWLVFWTVHSLDLLGVALDQGTKDRVVSTILHFLTPGSAFAGGPSNSQLPHLLPTYAAVCSLAIAGGPGENGGWDKLAQARQGIYDFFMSCKRADGSFVVCKGGEVDVRGTYCLLVVATLLDILTPELLHNVDHFISACQTYEGGFACSAFPFPTPGLETDDLFLRASMAEAHGGYTSCSLNSHFLLSAVPPSVHPSLESFPTPIDADAALRWSVLQQGEAIEGGGFRGRSNKLVDACYSWWVAGGVPVCEELVRRQQEKKRKEGRGGGKLEVLEGEGNDVEEDWEDVPAPPPLLNRVALQEFTLVAAQVEAGGSGGLRDKPGKRPDQYHTCNALSGLSIAQHRMLHSPSVVASNRASFDSAKGLPAVKPTSPEGGWEDESTRQKVRREVYAHALGWIEEEGGEVVLGGKDNRVNTTTPVFNILGLRLKPFINFFYGQ